MRISRKLEHINQALTFGQTGHQGLHDIKFVHNCLPEISVESISLQTRIGELNLSSPFIINAMTGGALETEEINREFAKVAAECSLAMAVGSQMSALKNKEVRSSYQIVRKMNPTGLIFANLGSEATVIQALEAVEMVEANALQIHLNVVQELIMPEGDRDFRGRLERIAMIVQRMPIPVIVKEVGFGIMGDSAEQLKSIGVTVIDVGGSGGTNFALIENSRRVMPIPFLNDWGIQTSIALLEVLEHYPARSIIASGGIIGTQEAAKAISLGASAVGIAGTFLKILQREGPEALKDTINTMHMELRWLMTALGASTIEQLGSVPLVIRGETAQWCDVRGIDFRRFAKRRLLSANETS